MAGSGNTRASLGARCERARSRLLLIDLQERLLSAMSTEAREAVERNTGRLIQGARELGVPIEVSRQYPQGLGDVVEPLRTALEDSASVTDKTAFSCCAASDLEQRLRDTGQVVVTGAETHICVAQTVLELLAAGVEVFVVADAVCSRDAALRHNGLERLRAAGAVITNHESVLFEWLRDAADPQFRSVSRLIR